MAELDRWTEMQRSQSTGDTADPPELSKENLFVSAGTTSLSLMLSLGEPELDRNVQNIRLDR